MPLSDTLKNSCNSVLDDLVTQLSTIQSDYYNELIEGQVRGRYWQGIRVTNSIPADGNEQSVDLTKKPSDQSESWQDVGVTLSSQISVSLEVNIYTGQNGRGYVVCGRVIESEVEYSRCVNVGPETYRNHDWVG